MAKKITKKKSNAGRRSKAYEWLTEDNLLVLQGWARDGMIDAEIAKRMGISKTTLYDWKNKHPEFANALKKGKEVVDVEVENALLRRALGYSYEETKIKKVLDPDGNIVGSEEISILRHVSPDVTAQIFWLKNRKPNEWRAKRTIDVQGQAIDKLDAVLSEVKNNL